MLGPYIFVLGLAVVLGLFGCAHLLEVATNMTKREEYEQNKEHLLRRFKFGLIFCISSYAICNVYLTIIKQIA